MSLPIEWEQRGCAVPTYWHNITSTTEKLVISWTLSLNQKKVTGWNKNEMEQIRASYVEEPVWPGSQLCTEGTAAAEAVKAWNDASSLWRQWHFFQQQRLVACPWVIFQEPGRQPRVQYPAHGPLHMQGTESTARAWGHSQLSIPLPTQVPPGELSPGQETPSQKRRVQDCS